MVQMRDRIDAWGVYGALRGDRWVAEIGACHGWSGAIADISYSGCSPNRWIAPPDSVHLFKSPRNLVLTG